MWDIKVVLDEGSEVVGTVTATYTSDEDVFTFIQRLPLDIIGQSSFINDAITARNSWRQKLIDDKNISDTANVISQSILNGINEIDGGN